MSRKNDQGKNDSGEKMEVTGGAEREETLQPQEEVTQEKREGTPLERLQSQLEEKTRESTEFFDKWLRLRAEFENYKKRMQKEKADLMRFGNESLLKALLPILDNLSRAIDHGKNAQEATPLLEGVLMIQKEFLHILEKFGVKPIEAVGEVFDPQKHEAISHEESDQEPNRVTSAVETGYFYYDRLLRPAKVIVSKAKAEPEEKPAE